MMWYSDNRNESNEKVGKHDRTRKMFAGKIYDPFTEGMPDHGEDVYIQGPICFDFGTSEKTELWAE